MLRECWSVVEIVIGNVVGVVVVVRSRVSCGVVVVVDVCVVGGMEVENVAV